MSASASILSASVPAAGFCPIRHRWTVSDFQRLSETGLLAPDARLELIEGELFEIAPIGCFHAGTVGILDRLFARAVADTAIIHVQNPILLGDGSEPQPDLLLLRPHPDYYLSEHPQAKDVLLLIEVSDSTVAFDRKTKVPLYARHGIPEVWLVVGPQRRHIEVYRDPQPEIGSYQTRLRLRQGRLTPVLLPEVEIRLSEVFIGAES
ncbi:MAG: Uma2 family endonuclease [Candidatus Competibacteraceae bacterium]